MCLYTFPRVQVSYRTFRSSLDFHGRLGNSSSEKARNIKIVRMSVWVAHDKLWQTYDRPQQVHTFITANRALLENGIWCIYQRLTGLTPSYFLTNRFIARSCNPQSMHNMHLLFPCVQFLEVSNTMYPMDHQFFVDIFHEIKPSSIIGVPAWNAMATSEPLAKNLPGCLRSHLGASASPRPAAAVLSPFDAGGSQNGDVRWCR